MGFFIGFHQEYRNKANKVNWAWDFTWFHQQWLVGGLVAIFGIFPLILGCFHHPNWRSHIFQRGGHQPPTRWWWKDIGDDPMKCQGWRDGSRGNIPEAFSMGIGVLANGIGLLGKSLDFWKKKLRGYGLGCFFFFFSHGWNFSHRCPKFPLVGWLIIRGVWN